LALQVMRMPSLDVMKSPEGKMWLGLVVSSVLTGLALFLSAGTIRYWQAWVYLVVSAVSSVPLILHMMKDPILLENRTKGGPTAEQRPIQKIIVACLAIPGIAAFVLPGLDHRFGWSSMPSWLSIIGVLLIIVAMWMGYRVFKENSYGSATVEITQDQKVISTGPYAIVRHPMYASAAVYFIGMALALGSYWGLIPALFMILGFVWRLFDEEELLRQNLSGYMDYCAKVRWRLLPGVF
jgi:protein-S-isoprenylcysteine O-methyltransferase Ste14